MAAKRPGKPSLTAGNGSSNGRVPPSGIPTPPSDLAPAGLAVWVEVWGLPFVAPSDRRTVERLCRLEAEAADLRSELHEHGACLKRPIQTARGDVVGWEIVPNPVLLPLRKIGAEAARLCDSLGLSPAGRQALGLDVLGAPVEPDFLDELRKRHAAERGEPDPGIDGRRVT
jgi:Phage terminase, small subunit